MGKLLGELPPLNACTKSAMRAREERKFTEGVNDDEETMSVEDVVSCDQTIDRRGGLGRSG
ncbi:unnamed protein product [Bathycoccus prasinos]